MSNKVKSKNNFIHETHSILHDFSLPLRYSKDRAPKKEVGNIPNWHKNLEIMRFYSGDGEIRLGSEIIEVSAGDIIVINPDILHAAVCDEHLFYDFFIIDTEFCRSCGVDILNLYFCEFINDSVLYDLLGELAEAVERVRNAPASCSDVFSVSCNLTRVLIHLCTGYLIEDTENRNFDLLCQKYAKRVITYLKNHIFEPLSLDGVAAALGVSKYYLSRQFGKATGATIFEYSNMLKCNEARLMLAEGANVSETAMSLGFENISYFTKTFKKYIGVLPSKYPKNSNI